MYSTVGSRKRRNTTLRTLYWSIMLRDNNKAVEDSEKICYDNTVNVPYKDRNFNIQTYFLFVWLFGICFRQSYFDILPNFGDGGGILLFHYIINQKRNHFIKQCPPPPVYREAADVRDVYLVYKKLSVQVGYWHTGGTMFYGQKKSKRCLLTTHKIRYIQWKLRQSSTEIVHSGGSTQVLLCLFPDEQWLWHFLYSVGPTSSVKPSYVHFRCVVGIHGGCG